MQYQTVPELPLSPSGHWPKVLYESDLSCCPECGANIHTYRTLCGKHYSSIMNTIGPEKPHIKYFCGGGWRKVYENWEGYCGIRKTKQLELNLEGT